MGLDLSKLTNVKEQTDRSVIAACPACQKAGSDATRNHLIIFPDGRFGCVAFPKDARHRKEVAKLAGGKRVSGLLKNLVVGEFLK